MHSGDNVMSILPIKLGRYIVIDTETTGLYNDDHIIELAAVEVKNGKMTGMQFNGFFKARTKINPRAYNVHHMNDSFFKRNYEKYEDDSKSLLISFLEFAKNSLIFAHNATFDERMLNKELSFWNLPTINLERFRCTMRIFKKMVKDNDKRCSLAKCCEYFMIEKNDKLFHSALYDTIMCAKVLCVLFDYTNFKLAKEKMRKSEDKSKLVTIYNRDNSIEFNLEDKENYILRDVNENLKFNDLNNHTPIKQSNLNKIQPEKPVYLINLEDDTFAIPSNEIAFLFGSELKNNFKSDLKDYSKKIQMNCKNDIIITDDNN